ncbi:hypothetical protein Z968_09925 [Clostridium novyi A str. 4552]|uniref:Uncharacterized protein n=1 Tax=Clostridium novyi A str. 4552 TaxID=1444289 RepID=A0A0A0I477_CLONO|nr:hypothetical protein Z968_09925 [Clostridium novyi A str. 4552]
MKKDIAKKVKNVIISFVLLFGGIYVIFKGSHFFRVVFIISIVISCIIKWYVSRKKNISTFPKLIMYIIFIMGCMYLILVYLNILII